MFVEIEGLEERRMLSASLSSSTKTLTVGGSSGADAINVSLNGSKLVVTQNGKTQSFTASSVKKIAVSAGKGNDKVTIASSVKIAATIDGGDGDDLLAGGGAADILTGGKGKDHLIGGGGGDRLNGGDDADDIDGNEGNDIEDGGAGDDDLSGDDGDDTLNGNVGNDTVNGGSGINSVKGGTGKDHFTHVVGGTDKIVDKSLDDDDDADEDEGDDAEAEIEGTVASTDLALNTITLAATATKPAQTFTLTAATKIRVNGVTSTLAAITVGSKVEIKVSTVDQSVLSVNVGGGDHDSVSEIKGTVASTDLALNTITLAATATNPAQTLTLTATTKIKVEGKTAATLADIPVGAKVEIKVSTVDQSVLSISVEDGEDDDEDGGSSTVSEVEGMVASTDLTLNTITLAATATKPARTFTLTSATKIKVEGKPAATLADIAIGAKVEIKISTVDQSVLSVEVDD